jgi:hypothetical protein
MSQRDVDAVAQGRADQQPSHHDVVPDLRTPTEPWLPTIAIGNIAKASASTNNV